jgi:hypothetical protein
MILAPCALDVHICFLNDIGDKGNEEEEEEEVEDDDEEEEQEDEDDEEVTKDAE